jgi:hypothetical protein
VGELDELLRPTVPDEAPRPDGAERPMRLGSQFYVAFLGGAIGATIIALLNAAALGLPARKRWIIAGLGLLGLVASGLVMGIAGLDAGGNDTGLVVRVIGVVAWGGMYLVQRSADRVYGYRSKGEDEYDSMWTAGIAAVLAGLLAQFVAAEIVGAI